MLNVQRAKSVPEQEPGQIVLKWVEPSFERPSLKSGTMFLAKSSGTLSACNRTDNSTLDDIKLIFDKLSRFHKDKGIDSILVPMPVLNAQLEQELYDFIVEKFSEHDLKVTLVLLPAHSGIGPGRVLPPPPPPPPNDSKSPAQISDIMHNGAFRSAGLYQPPVEVSPTEPAPASPEDPFGISKIDLISFRSDLQKLLQTVEKLIGSI